MLNINKMNESSDTACNTASPGVFAPVKRHAGIERATADALPGVFVGSDIYRQAAFGANHPLSIPRVATVMDLCAVLGWLDGGVFQLSPVATPQQLAAFHDPLYIEALQLADSQGRVTSEVRKKYRIGTMENPLFPGLFQQAATSVAGSVLAAELSASERVVFHPSGGTHHGRRARASGFCYFNDPVFAILTLLNQDVERVLYVDLDAHHGDGVQDAFAADPRVFTISIHETGRWPYSGAVDDRAHGRARNLPVPKAFNDSELEFVMHQAVMPLAQRFAPRALVVTCGADGLHDDPLSTMSLSNQALWTAVELLTTLTTRIIVLGGGGYNPWSVARCWSGLWARLAGFEIPQCLPPEAQDILRRLQCDLIDDDDDISPAWITTIADLPRPGPVRDDVRRVVESVLRQ